MRIAKNNKKNFPRFALDNNEHFFFGNDCYFIVGNDIEYLYLFLNSTLTGYLFRYYIYSFDETGFKIFTEYFKNIPVLTPNVSLLQYLKNITKKRYDIYEIDKIFYKYYNFTDYEILTIEQSIDSFFL